MYLPVGGVSEDFPLSWLGWVHQGVIYGVKSWGVVGEEINHMGKIMPIQGVPEFSSGSLRVEVGQANSDVVAVEMQHHTDGAVR